MPSIDTAILNPAVIFASFLITYYMVYEDGLFGVFRKIRSVMGVNQPLMDINGDPTGDLIANGSAMSKIFTCPICLSAYVTALVYLVGGGECLMEYAGNLGAVVAVFVAMKGGVE